jgi:hypothetical protein
MRSISTNYFFLITFVGFLAAGFFAAAFLAAGFLAAAASAASAFFLAATLAVVEPLAGIAIGPFLEEGLVGFDSQGLRFGRLLDTLLNISRDVVWVQSFFFHQLFGH